VSEQFAPAGSDTWKRLATQLRVDSIRSTTVAGSGHPTSSLSAADLMAVLLAAHLRYDLEQPRALGNDQLIFSKGHAAPLLYAVLKAAGAISDTQLMTLRKRGSVIEGHPTPRLPYVEVATGSLGQGLAVAVGMALAAKRLDRVDDRFWVLLGDSEMAEGSIYESLEVGGFYGLSNLIAILDMNRLGQRGPTMLGWDGERYAARARAFGWESAVIDGHDPAAIDAAYSAAERSSRPTLVVAQTKKGAGVSFLTDKEGWHGKALSHEEATRALVELGWSDGPALVVKPKRPNTCKIMSAAPVAATELPHYRPGAQVATRAAFGDALAALGSSNPRVVVLDGEVSNSTYTDKFAKAHPERFFEIYIAEQQLVSAAVGLQTRGWRPFAATFAAFFTRAFDQIRMAAISQATLNLVGSHAGVSIGEDGPSQMGLEDLAMMRAVHDSVVLYPCCANATAKLVVEMAARDGIQYLRTTREKTAVLYPPTEEFRIGGSKVLRRSDHDRVGIVAAGITVHEALKAYEQLRARGVMTRIIDLYSIKPVDRATLHEAARECSGGLLVVEDHHPEGGLADAVAEAFDGIAAPTMRRLGVRSMPGSATPEEQLSLAGIEANAIVESVAAGLLKRADARTA
jgi:transketolase